MAYISSFEFVRIPILFYKIMGQDIYNSTKNNPYKLILIKILLYGGFINFMIEFLLQGVYFGLSLKSGEHLAAYAAGPSLGFGVVGFFKMVTLHLNKLPIRNILDEFEEIHPKTLDLQKDFRAAHFYKALKPVMQFYSGLCVSNNMYYIFFPLLKAISISLVMRTKFDFPLPLLIWYPYDPKKYFITYVLTYAMQFYASFITAVAYSTSDSILVSLVDQLCMQFTYISLRFHQFKPESDKKNYRFLKEMAKQHIRCLQVCENVDKLFGFSLLLNLIASSLTLCFVGFQVTSSTVGEFLQNIVLLLTSLSQVFIICFYGNKLINTSQAVGEAVFGHEWYSCDLKYRKLVALLVIRSQKSAAIHAPTFPPISLESFMKVVSMAYQFFTVLLQTAN